MPYEMRRTPTVAKTNASGTARPTRPTVPCGLMLAAIDGAISATEMPIASQIDRLPVRRRPGALAGAAMTPPFLFAVDEREANATPKAAAPGVSPCAGSTNPGISSADLLKGSARCMQHGL